MAALQEAAAAIVGSLAAAAYLDARFLIRHDLSSASVNGGNEAGVKFIAQRFLQGKLLIYHLFEEHAHGPNANNLFLIFEERSWTYKQFFQDIQRVGNWLIGLGIQKRELVAIDGGNSPEYLLVWFGLEAIGAYPSFVNCNLTSRPLVHCVKLCDARLLIADYAQKSLVQPCQDELKANGVQTVYYDADFIASLTDGTPTPEERRSDIRPDEITSLMYTSGTTGVPKGIIKRRGGELKTARTVSQYLKLKPGDRMYTALPLYHGTAHSLCITPSIFAGSTVILSQKFSHKTFWPEVRKSQANIVQYVGELCRYLVNASPSPLDKHHNVKMVWGNGMRPDVWEVFRQRFGIEIINELYAATDGVGSSFNANRGDFGRNAIAIRGLLWHWVNGDLEKRVKIDFVTEEIVRDKDGFAIECKAGEPGETVYQTDPATAEAVFAGYYKNKGASEKRKIRDLFKKGDMWFRSGDMMREDADGRVYFVDRLGDTFRWKSENVSTNEVSDVMGMFDQITETNVYGTTVPNADGRAGCAAIVLAPGVTEDTFDFARLAKHVIAMLPRYAVPLFLRIVTKLEYTSTMKLQKGQLKAEGIDLEKIQEGAQGTADKIYWLPPSGSTYVPFRHTDYNELKAGRARL